MKHAESQCTNRTKPQNYSFSSDPSTCQGHAAAFNAFSPSALSNLSLPLRFVSAGAPLCGHPKRRITAAPRPAQKRNKHVIARPQGRGALSTKCDEVPLGCNLLYRWLRRTTLHVIARSEATWQSPGTILDNSSTKGEERPNRVPSTSHCAFRYILPGDSHGPMALGMTDLLRFCVDRYGSIVVTLMEGQDPPLRCGLYDNPQLSIVNCQLKNRKGSPRPVCTV